MLESPGDREMLDRLAAEDPLDRAVRRAWERWVVARRLWQRFDRERIVGAEARMAVVVRVLWPMMPEAHRDGLLAAVRASGKGLKRPRRFEDVVGGEMAAHLRIRGFADDWDRQDGGLRS